MLGTAWACFTRPFPLKRMFLVEQFLIQPSAIGFRDDLIKELDPQISLSHIGHTGLGEEAC
jgi:hypothetical protein